MTTLWPNYWVLVGTTVEIPCPYDKTEGQWKPRKWFRVDTYGLLHQKSSLRCSNCTNYLYLESVRNDDEGFYVCSEKLHAPSHGISLDEIEINTENPGKFTYLHVINSKEITKLSATTSQIMSYTWERVAEQLNYDAKDYLYEYVRTWNDTAQNLYMIRDIANIAFENKVDRLTYDIQLECYFLFLLTTLSSILVLILFALLYCLTIYKRNMCKGACWKRVQEAPVVYDYAY